MWDKNIKYLFNSIQHTNVECKTHLHNSIEIVLVTNGTLSMEIGSKMWTIEEGNGAFIQPFELHGFKSDVDNTCHILMFSGELVPSFFQYLKTQVPKTPLFAPSKESLTLAKSLLSNFNNENEPIIKLQAVLAPLCYEIYSQCDFATSNAPLQDVLEQALDYIHNHFTESLTSKQVAQIIGVHPITFSKGFNRSVGSHFNSYLNHLRCSYAARLLKNSNSTVADIAHQAGFGSIRSCNRAFLNIYGITPTVYRHSSVI